MKTFNGILSGDGYDLADWYIHNKDVIHWDFKLNTDSEYDLDSDYKTKEEAIEKAYELYQDKIMDNGYQLDIDICEYMVGDGDPVILREFTETLELDEEEFYNEYEEHNINHLLI